MQCNIDQRGRKVRLVTGAVVDAAGIVLIVAGLLRRERTLIIVGAILSVAGSFMIFEGAKGWCVVRALGIKTKI